MYYVFMFICYITWPVRLLMFWWPQRNLKFAISLLYWRSWAASVVWGISRHETGIFSSRKFLEHNNAFAMSFAASTYCSGFTTITAPGEPALFASYLNVYQSVYDFYYYTKTRKGGVMAQAISEVPKGISYGNGVVNYEYVSRVVLAGKAAGYFTAPFAVYLNAVQSHVSYYKSSGVNVICNCVLSVFAFAYLFYLYSRSGYRFSIMKLFR